MSTIPNSDDINNQLQKIVEMLISKNENKDWYEIVLDFEILSNDAQDLADFICLTIIKIENDFKRSGFFLSLDDQQLIFDLKNLFPEKDRLWSTITFEIQKNRTFKVNLSYDNPKRLNGIYDYQSEGRFEEYLKKYAQ